MQATASESRGSPSHCGQASPDQGKAGSQVHWPKKEALSPRPTQTPRQSPQPAGVGAVGTSHLPKVPRRGPPALTGQLLDCIPLGPFLWTACLSPFKPCSRDPQAVACGHQTLISQGAALSDSGQSVLPVTGSSRHLLDTRPGSLQWPRSKISKAGRWTPLRGRWARSPGVSLASQLPV